MRDFDLGWAPRGSDWLTGKLAAAGVNLDLACRADLVRAKDGAAPFAYFRGRAIFPIKNISRQVAGFGGRVIDQGEPKYLNSADSAFFTKGHLLYGFDSSRMAISREKSAILVEGYLDLLALAQVGLVNVVATCGTAFTSEQAKLIRRGAPEVVLLFDGDQAGLKATVRSADIALCHGLEPRIVTLPLGQDPADLVMERGREGIDGALAGAVGYVPFLKGLAGERGKDRTLQERAVRQILGTVAHIGDPLRREYVLMETAEVFGLGLDLLRSMVPAEPAPARKAAGGSMTEGTAIGPAAVAPPAADPRPRRQGGPAVRRSLARVNAPSIESDLMAHILMDESGGAAEVFLAERGNLELDTPQARLLGEEFAAWQQARGDGAVSSPREFVLDRWNTAGDQDYRSYVSQLVEQREHPVGTDFRRVARDCLARLQQDRRNRPDR